MIQTATTTKFEVKSFDPVKEDTGWNLAAAKGIKAAKRDFGETSRPYNIAVLPADGEGMYVYLYPAQVKAGVYPLGADVRYHVSPDGAKITEKRQMHKTIIESESVSAGVPGTAAGGYHTHVLSDLPEDTDVLLVLTRKPRIPEIVVAGTHLFTIDVNGISPWLISSEIAHPNSSVVRTQPLPSLAGASVERLLVGIADVSEPPL